MEANEQKIYGELEQVNEEGRTIESRQAAAQAKLRAQQKEKQKVQVGFYYLHNLYGHYDHDSSYNRNLLYHIYCYI